jgi:hypothetical protein
MKFNGYTSLLEISKNIKFNVLELAISILLPLLQLPLIGLNQLHLRSLPMNPLNPGLLENLLKRTPLLILNSKKIGTMKSG